MAQKNDRSLRILMMIHRQADNSPYCFYVHEQAKALRALGHDVVVISCVGVTPMMERLRPAQAAVERETPTQAVVDGVPVVYPRALTLAVSAMQAVEMIGMPEAKLILSQAVAYCATAPKSNPISTP